MLGDCVGFAVSIRSGTTHSVICRALSCPYHRTALWAWDGKARKPMTTPRLTQRFQRRGMGSLTPSMTSIQPMSGWLHQALTAERLAA